MTGSRATEPFRKAHWTSGFRGRPLISELVGPAIGRITNPAGCDFGMIGMEHTGFSFETVKAALRYVHDAGMANLACPPSKSADHIARACDVGAQGISPVEGVENTDEIEHGRGLPRSPQDAERRGRALSRDPPSRHLFEPVQIRPKVLRNRFIHAPHCTGFGGS